MFEARNYEVNDGYNVNVSLLTRDPTVYIMWNTHDIVDSTVSIGTHSWIAYVVNVHESNTAGNQSYVATISDKARFLRH